MSSPLRAPAPPTSRPRWHAPTWRGRVMLSLPGFLGLAAIVSASDLVATLPRTIGELLARNAGLRMLACPFPVPPFTVKQHWHARFHQDPANRWLREQVAALLMTPARTRVRSPRAAP